MKSREFKLVCPECGSFAFCVINSAVITENPPGFYGVTLSDKQIECLRCGKRFTSLDYLDADESLVEDG